MTNSSKEIDKKLIIQLNNNGVEAFDSLFLQYSEKLYCFAFSLLKNNEDAKEIVQEAFVRVWEKRKQIDSSKSFKSFLFTVSYNLIVDQLRHRLKDKQYREFLIDYIGAEKIELHTNIDYNIIKSKIRGAVEELPEKRKQIYVLSREVGLSHKEIASKLGISTKTVENQIGLALKHIKLRLGNEIVAIFLFMSIF
jgi:RNA polymerase sigma-70 factor (ECF subfamily)